MSFIGFTVKASTWISNSHGLYDYESRNVSEKTYRCYGRHPSYRMLRKGLDVTLVTESAGCQMIRGDPEVETIAKLSEDPLEGGYLVVGVDPIEDWELRHPTSEPDSEDMIKAQERLKFWMIVRSLKDSSSLALKEGQSIKLGRLAFKLKKVVLESDETSVETEKNDLFTGEIDHWPRREADVNNCRVCLSELSEAIQPDPLVSACKCAGSMKWIHLSCLRTWMRGRLNMTSVKKICRIHIWQNDDSATCVFWRPLECELCQHPYPTFLETDQVGCELNQKLELLEIPKPAVPFIVLGKSPDRKRAILHTESHHYPNSETGYHFVSFKSRSSVILVMRSKDKITLLF